MVRINHPPPYFDYPRGSRWDHFQLLNSGKSDEDA
jgi:hypothetical protein